MDDNMLMDPTLARLLGVVIARLLSDGWTPKEISEWVHGVATEIGRPRDVDADGGLAVAMRTARCQALADAAAACKEVALDCTDISQEDWTSEARGTVRVAASRSTTRTEDGKKQQELGRTRHRPAQ